MENHLYIVFLSLGILLAAARLLGELTKQLGLTALLGEMLAGILLGPTFLGKIAPHAGGLLFPLSGGHGEFLTVMAEMSVVLFLFVSGMEVKLTDVVRQRKAAISVGGLGLVVPFAVGLSFAMAFPSLLGEDQPRDPVVFALFYGTALCISALPVIAKILSDLNLYRTDFGMIVMPAAVFQDLVGWFIFAVIMGLLGTIPRFSIGMTIGLTILFTAGMLTVGRYLFDRLLPIIQAHWTWPGGIVGFGVATAFLAAAFTDWIGIHPLFGGFIAGIALGDSRHMREQTRAAFRTFIGYFFSPLFFAYIGLKLDFLSHFELLPVLVVTVLASIGKIAGSFLGGRLAGLSIRDSHAIGHAMNARGAMQIILGLAALNVHVISAKTFVALVIMAIVTSLASGPLIKSVLRLSPADGFWRYLKPAAFRRFTKPTSAVKLVGELAAALEVFSKRQGGDPESIMRQIPESIIGIGHGVAVPHVRITGLSRPRLAVGISSFDVDIQTPDEIPVRVVFLLVTPEGACELPLQIYASIARAFSSANVFERALAAKNFTEILAAVRPTEDE